eukprot:TRINITY_DN21247_c0_g1_i2.p1 TRINITY_DN21247_c0_g1~~TRINITY_DN21247_c0_g1_i2.p1  ORF type:complete len:962 (+),score=263.28 TRINITY_DN21247_c0_g1_i2:86-2887(+)
MQRAGAGRPGAGCRSGGGEPDAALPEPGQVTASTRRRTAGDGYRRSGDRPVKRSVNDWLSALCGECSDGAPTWAMALETGDVATLRALTRNDRAGVTFETCVVPNTDGAECAEIRAAAPGCTVFEKTSHWLVAQLVDGGPASRELERRGFGEGFGFVWLDYCGTLASASGRQRQSDVVLLLSSALMSSTRRSVLAVTLTGRGSPNPLYPDEVVDSIVALCSSAARSAGKQCSVAGVATYRPVQWPVHTVAFIVGPPLPEPARPEPAPGLVFERGWSMRAAGVAAGTLPRLAGGEASRRVGGIFASLAAEHGCRRCVVLDGKLLSVAAALSSAGCELLRVAVEDPLDAAIAAAVVNGISGCPEILPCSGPALFRDCPAEVDAVWFGYDGRQAFTAEDLRKCSEWHGLGSALRCGSLRGGAVLGIQLPVTGYGQPWDGAEVDWIVSAVSMLARQCGYGGARVLTVVRWASGGPRLAVVLQLAAADPVPTGQRPAVDTLDWLATVGATGAVMAVAQQIRSLGHRCELPERTEQRIVVSVPASQSFPLSVAYVERAGVLVGRRHTPDGGVMSGLSEWAASLSFSAALAVWERAHQRKPRTWSLDCKRRGGHYCGKDELRRAVQDGLGDSLAVLEPEPGSPDLIVLFLCSPTEQTVMLVVLSRPPGAGPRDDLELHQPRRAATTGSAAAGELVLQKPAQWSVLTDWDLHRPKQPVSAEKRFRFVAPLAAAICRQLSLSTAFVAEPGGFEVVPALATAGVAVTAAAADEIELSDLRRGPSSAVLPSEAARTGGVAEAADCLLLLDGGGGAPRFRETWGSALETWCSHPLKCGALCALVEVAQSDATDRLCDWFDSLGMRRASPQHLRVRCRARLWVCAVYLRGPCPGGWEKAWGEAVKAAEAVAGAQPAGDVRESSAHAGRRKDAEDSLLRLVASCAHR